MPTYYSRVTYTGNGNSSFAIPFPFIETSHIKVYLDSVLKTENTDYTITSSNVVFTSAPSNGVIILIQRDTPKDARLVDFTDGSVLTEADLDRSADQNFYVVQENFDDGQSHIALDTDDKFDAQSKVIKNVANPVANTDAVNKQFISTNLPNINLVASISSAVTAVANNEANINAVNSNSSNINSAVANANNINSAVANATNINAVVANANNINDVKNNEANINIVAGINSAVTQVSNINADVTQVSAIYDKVTTVANNIADINQVYTDILKVVAVANDLQEATSEIDTVANAINNVDNVGNNINDVITVSNNINNINSFFQQYKVSATQPSSPSTGDLWYDTVNSRLKIYTGSAWNLASDYLENLINEYTYNITSTVSTVSGSDANSRTFAYTIDSQVNVFLNGVRLIPTTDYTLSSGNTISFTSSLQNGDVVFAQVFTKLTVAQEAQLDNKVSTAQQAVTDAQTAQAASESARDLSQQYRDSSLTYSQNSSTSATDSANSATASANSATASANSATASANSATSAQNSLNTFNDKFIASSTAPSSPSDGDLWYDTANVRLKIYISGSGWQNAGAYLEGLISNYTYTATNGQTAFSVDDSSNTLSFSADANVFVFLNGVRLTPTSDYSLSGTNTCTLTSGTQVGDTLYIEVITKISLTEEATLQGYVSTALGYKNDAETAKTAAETAQTAAELAESNAATSETNSSNSATASSNSATASASSASSASASASAASSSASSAASSASAAAQSASDAAQSAGGGTVKITANDTTASVLTNKVVAGNGLTKTILNSGGDEDLELKLSMTETSITPTAGQTNFTVTYTVGYIQVFLNGIKLINGTDFTATNGTSVVLSSGATTSDVIEFVVWA